uniref:Uncharacterized protein n=1 Tax=Arundo donax TaxID=35708 RepID=A0A0A8ZBS2_ARUDO
MVAILYIKDFQVRTGLFPFQLHALSQFAYVA